MADSPDASGDEIHFRFTFTDRNGRVLTERDLQAYAGPARQEVRSDDAVPTEAQVLHQKGREAGATGDSAAALAYFARAAKLAPNWPYPLYDAAFTHLLQGDFKTAYDYYRRVDAMAPRGFFTVKTAVDALAKEAAGILPQGLYLYFVTLEWETDRAKKYRAIVEMTEKVPQFAPGWKVLAMLEEDDDKRLAALDNGLRADPDAGTRAVLFSNKALLLDRLGQRDAAVALARELVEDPTLEDGHKSTAKIFLAHLLRTDDTMTP